MVYTMRMSIFCLPYPSSLYFQKVSQNIYGDSEAGSIVKKNNFIDASFWFYSSITKQYFCEASAGKITCTILFEVQHGRHLATGLRVDIWGR